MPRTNLRTIGAPQKLKIQSGLKQLANAGGQFAADTNAQNIRPSGILIQMSLLIQIHWAATTTLTPHKIMDLNVVAGLWY